MHLGPRKHPSKDVQPLGGIRLQRVPVALPWQPYLSGRQPVGPALTTRIVTHTATNPRFRKCLTNAPLPKVALVEPESSQPSRQRSSIWRMCTWCCTFSWSVAFQVVSRWQTRTALGMDESRSGATGSCAECRAHLGRFADDPFPLAPPRVGQFMMAKEGQLMMAGNNSMGVERK
jgi:hypothetical protein